MELWYTEVVHVAGRLGPWRPDTEAHTDQHWRPVTDQDAEGLEMLFLQTRDMQRFQLPKLIDVEETGTPNCNE
jgi:hypothetical protein